MLRRSVLAVGVCLVIGCGSSRSSSTPTSPSSTTSAPTPAPAPAIDVNGSWTGTASGATFAFTVSNGSVSTMTLRQIPACGSLVLIWTLTSAVTSNAFSYTASASHPDISGTVSGRFASATSASGDMNVTLKSGCRATLAGTWTASK